MKAHLALVAASLLATLSSGAAPAAIETTTEVKLRAVTWEIRYASKKEDGTLIDAKGRMTTGPDRSRGTLFAAGQCKIEGDILMLRSFVISQGGTETSSTAPQTCAILKNDGRFHVVGGPARTRMGQQ
jgi:hypothetical protein